MDRYEYKIRIEEIRNFVVNGEYQEAADLADGIDWSRVKSVSNLCAVSDVYKKVRRYSDAVELLELAYARDPGHKGIIYNLCELYIKTGDVVKAVYFYKEFTRIGYRDARRLILQYKLYVAQDVSKEERIEVLEQYNNLNYTEKWAYELAYLYHCMGLATKCVEECDHIIMWFRDGKYVRMAMELKMLHEKLNPDQQFRYDHPDLAGEYEPGEEPAPEFAEEESAPAPETMAADTRELVPTEAAAEGEQEAATRAIDTAAVEERLRPEGLPEVTDEDEARALALGYTRVFHREGEEDYDIEVKTANVGEFSTTNIQEAIARNVAPYLGDDDSDTPDRTAVTRAIVSSVMDDTDSLDDPDLRANPEDFLEEGEEEEAPAPAPEVRTEVFFGETGEISKVVYPLERSRESVQGGEYFRDDEEDAEAVQAAMTAQPPEEIADVMTQEADGQLGLVLPENPQVVRQITGQMNLGEMMAQWDQMKREQEQKRTEEYHERVKRDTGEMLTDFERKLVNSAYGKALRGEEIEPEEELPEVEVYTDPGYEEPSYDEIGDEAAYEEAEEEAAAEPAYEEAEEEAAAEPACEEAEEAAAVEPAYEEAEEETAEEPAYEEAEEVPGEAAAFAARAAAEEAGSEEEPEAETAEETETEAAEEITEEIAETGEITETEEISEEEAEEEDNAPDFAADSVFEEEEELPETEGEETVPILSAEEETEEEPEEETASGSAAEAPTLRETVLGVRELSREEKELFGPYIQSKEARRQLADLLDNISMASFTGNVILAGDDGIDTPALAVRIMKEARTLDRNFSGKTAKVEAKALNKKNIEETLKALGNGGLIIEKAGELDAKTITDLKAFLERDNVGIIVILTDRHRSIDRLIREYPEFCRMFNARMEVRALSDKKLVAFAKQYANDQEYSISEMGVLALHTKIESRQTNDHAVNVVEVKEIVDEAIRRVRKKNLTHFFDVLLGKRYDKEDMIILGEREFA